MNKLTFLDNNQGKTLHVVRPNTQAYKPTYADIVYNWRGW